MRIAVLSDIHGNLPALGAVVADLRRHGVDAVVNLGDSLSGPLLPLATAQFLMERDWVQLAGNHERQILEIHPGSAKEDQFAHAELTDKERAWIASLPSATALSPEVFLCHGTPTSDRTALLQTAERNATSSEIAERLGELDAEVILCGHSHVARSVRTGSGQLIVNPGSVGHPAYADENPYPYVVESGSPDARYAIVEKRAGLWLSSLITVPYRHHSVAALAASRGCPDWESALLTGYMPARP